MQASFKYDALGRRIEKTINGKTTQYLYDGADIVQEIEGGMVSANYIRTLNIDEPLARIKADGTVRYYQQDALGSVIALTDENGATKTQYVYDPFGNTAMIGEESDQPFQFAGRENDGGGHLFERNRTYSLELQRYISEDPIRFDGGDVNFYARVGNNPVNWVDPMGLVYLDINISFGWRGIGLTGGGLFDDKGNVYPYVGVGLMTPGPSISLTTSADNPTPGVNVGIQGGRGVAYQIGISMSGDAYTEKGISSPGVAVTSYYVFDHFDLNSSPNAPIEIKKCH